MKPALELEGASIVLRGTFSPYLFQPAWFARHQLLRDSEVEKPDSLVVTNDVTTFECGWLRVEVTSDRFTVHSLDGSNLEPLRDLVIGTFTLLEQTPFYQMGLNRYFHFRMLSEDEWHLIGDTLVPKALWQSLFEGRVGMRVLSVEGKRPNSTARYVRVTVEPSIKVLPHGLFIQTNEHYQREADDPAGRADLLEILKQTWGDSLAYSKKMSEWIVAQTLEGRV